MQQELMGGDDDSKIKHQWQYLKSNHELG